MAGGSLISQLIVRLVDEVSGPAQKVAASLNGITSQAGQTIQSAIGRNHAAMAQNNAALQQDQSKLLGVLATYYMVKQAVMAPLMAATGFETLLTSISQKASIAGTNLDDLGTAIQRIGRDTNLGAMQVGAIVDQLATLGLSAPMALSIAEPLARATAAYKLQTDDLAKAAFSLMANMGIKPEQIAQSIDMMSAASKAGGFELADMAARFPKLTEAAAALGMQGTKGVAQMAAAIEVSKLGADTGMRAASNYYMFLQRLQAGISPAGNKVFGKFGINVGKELAAAAKAGEDPVQHMLALFQKLEAIKPGTMAGLFKGGGLSFVQTATAHMDLYQKTLDAVQGSAGTVLTDYNARIATAQGTMDRFTNSMQDFNIAIGKSLIPGLNKLLDTLGPVLQKLEQWVTDNPKVVAAVLAISAALAGLWVAEAVGGFGVHILKAGWFLLYEGALQTAAGVVILKDAFVAARVAAAAMGVGGFGSFVAGLRGMAMAVPGVSAIGGALTAIGATLAGVSAPVWGAIAVGVAALAIGGYFIWKYWGPIVGFIKGVSNVLYTELKPAIDFVMPFLRPFGDAFNFIGIAVKSAWDNLSNFFGIFTCSASSKPL